ncbi:MAG: hypothetical protein JJU34_13700 [Lunatimonas sp.]|uniref:hypothetical protein n=1 Tax=Lunatimonas sp. TaxID=2060141 RepID=UPI00263A658C|nr:hypothetical protein [Lunatimonas sp.]MCC5938327.1 hypothetical protein [Lunatimonas sp.]
MEVKNSPLRPYWSMPDDHVLGEIALRVLDAHMVDALFPVDCWNRFLPVPFGFSKLAVYLLNSYQG